MIEEMKKELTEHLIPFWKNLHDSEYGGYYGYLGYDLDLDKEAVKGCILMSRITWFFSAAYKLLGEEDLLSEARHSFAFLKNACYDREEGGMFWSVTFDGKPADTTKHTYNQAFTVYALAEYYDASKDPEALSLAMELYHVIEERCRDKGGYLEAFDRGFQPVSNEKLSENGVMAERTMNTLLHVFEAYTELFRVSGIKELRGNLEEILTIFEQRIYNPNLHRMEVFFDHEYNSLINLISYGHDIETSWLLDRGLEVLGDEELQNRFGPIARSLSDNIYRNAFDGHSLPQESENGMINETRVWWVQAETVNGFFNAWQHEPERTEYKDAAFSCWEFIRDRMIDQREGSEWFSEILPTGEPVKKPIVDPWKCPYHNGRMCMEMIRRSSDTE